MEEQREKTLAKLYTLRAGLAYIAQQYDYCNKAIAEVETYRDRAADRLANTEAGKNAKIVSVMQTVNRRASTPKQVSKVFDEEIALIQKSIDEDNNYIKYNKRNLGKKRVWIFIYGLALAAITAIWAFLLYVHGQATPFDIGGTQKGQLIAVAICAPLSLIVAEIYIAVGYWCRYDTEYGTMMGGGVVLCGIPFLICIIITIYNLLRLFHNDAVIIVLFFVVYVALALYSLLFFGYKSTKGIIKDRRITLKDDEKDLKDCMQFRTDYLDMLKKIDEQAAAAHKKIEEPIKISGVLYNALVAEFGTLLDERDWQYLDFIIYYYETGRVDSIKEALLLADNERRMDTLVQSVKKASQEISRNITKGLNSIKSYVNASVNAVSQRVDGLAGQISGLRNATDSLVSATQMNNALLNSATSDSGRIMDDIRHLRTIADDAKISHGGF